MKPKKKNKVFTFLCSFIPGAAEMYIGFMKMGLSLMCVFVASFAIPALFGASDVIMFLAFILWFFGFFHARNLAACSDEEFAQLDDIFIWEEFTEGSSFKFVGNNARRIFAWFLIFTGAALLWTYLRKAIYTLIPDYLWSVLYPIVYNVPRIAVAIIIIVIGVKLISGKKEQLENDNTKVE